MADYWVPCFPWQHLVDHNICIVLTGTLTGGDFVFLSNDLNAKMLVSWVAGIYKVHCKDIDLERPKRRALFPLCLCICPFPLNDYIYSFTLIKCVFSICTLNIMSTTGMSVHLLQLHCTCNRLCFTGIWIPHCSRSWNKTGSWCRQRALRK